VLQLAIEAESVLACFRQAHRSHGERPVDAIQLPRSLSGTRDDILA